MHAGSGPPPVQAFGALIQGYTRAAFLERALEAMKEFCRRGGVPDNRMLNCIVPLCLQSGSYSQAVQVGWRLVLCSTVAPAASCS